MKKKIVNLIDGLKEIAPLTIHQNHPPGVSGS